MTTGFKERLRDACIAAGISIGDACSEDRPVDCRCCTELAQRCGCSPETVERWIDTDGKSMTGEELLALRDATHMRGEFLLNGVGPITRSALSPALSPEIATALLLLDGLTANEIQIWLRYGKRMLDKHR